MDLKAESHCINDLAFSLNFQLSKKLIFSCWLLKLERATRSESNSDMKNPGS